MIVLADDWSRSYMVQAFPQLQDAAAITGLCERRPYWVAKIEVLAPDPLCPM